MMVLYALDKNLEVILVIDEYTSLIWANRYVENGDCELYIPASLEVFNACKIGNYLIREDDEMVCVIRSVEIDTDSETGNHLIIKGIDVKSFLDQRVSEAGPVSSTVLEEILLEKISHALSASATEPRRALYKANGNALLQINAATGLEGSLAIHAGHENLGEEIRNALNYMGWGIKFVFNSINKTISPVIYDGNNLTTKIIFSKEYENLLSSKYIEEAAGAENVALSYAEDEDSVHVDRYAGNAEGVDRFEMSARCTGIGKTMVYADFELLFPGGTFLHVGDVYEYSLDPCLILAVPGDEADFSDLDIWDGEVINGQLYHKSLHPVHVGTMDTDSPTSDTEVTLMPIVRSALLRQQGIMQISNKKTIHGFEAVVDPNATFKFRQDYNLGDVVTIENELGIIANARLIEMVESEDSNGYSCEPGFKYILPAKDTIDVRVINGSWSIVSETVDGVLTLQIVSVDSSHRVPVLSDLYVGGANIVSYTGGGGFSATLVLDHWTDRTTVLAVCRSSFDLEVSITHGRATIPDYSVPAVGSTQFYVVPDTYSGILMFYTDIENAEVSGVSSWTKSTNPMLPGEYLVTLSNAFTVVSFSVVCYPPAIVTASIEHYHVKRSVIAPAYMPPAISPYIDEEYDFELVQDDAGWNVPATITVSGATLVSYTPNGTSATFKLKNATGDAVSISGTPVQS